VSTIANSAGSLMKPAGLRSLVGAGEDDVAHRVRRPLLTDAQDLTAQCDALTALGAPPDRIYDHGLTGTSRSRPGLREALAACRAGDTLQCQLSS
jgi:hypothetical protein